MHNELSILELTAGVAIAFAAIHFWCHPLHKWLYYSELVATSFGGGMAITYVFMHLLPELEHIESSFGVFPMHIIALVGFLIFFGAQRWVWSLAQNNQDKLHQGGFWIQIAFVSLYNFLLIYSIPEQFEENTLFALVYVIAIGLHLLSSDHHLSEKYPKLFHQQGRFILIVAVTSGLVTDIFFTAADRTVSGILTALLSGFLIFNIFKEELPEHQSTKFRWFLGGVIVYILLLVGSGAL